MAPNPEPFDVIVIGGGVSGLACAGQLSRAGLGVALIEGRGRLGGRIDTRRPRGWPLPVELGAEFIHGGNADLWRLVRDAGLKFRKLPDTHWLAGGGAVRRIPDLDRELGSVTRLIKPEKAGELSFAGYFRKYPPRVSPDAWMLARGFVEGFEAAPLDRISARSIAGESMDEQHQYSLPGGYGQVVATLAGGCAQYGVRMMTGTLVRSVKWRRGRVTVAALGAHSLRACEFSARAAVIALPVGVLKARSGAGSVRFHPPLRRKQAVIDRMQMGDVVRLAIRFRSGSLRRLLPGVLKKQRQGFGFIHSTIRGVPVWWSLSSSPVLVAWAGGPDAKALLRMAPAARFRRALASLATILGVAPRLVREAAVDWLSADWTHDPLSRGAYSFTAAGQDEAGEILRRVVQDTLFFAGEATADGPELGTVHGALSSGLRAAGEVKRALGCRPSR